MPGEALHSIKRSATGSGRSFKISDYANGDSRDAEIAITISLRLFRPLLHCLFKCVDLVDINDVTTARHSCNEAQRWDVRRGGDVSPSSTCRPPLSGAGRQLVPTRLAAAPKQMNRRKPLLFNQRFCCPAVRKTFPRPITGPVVQDRRSGISG